MWKAAHWACKRGKSLSLSLSLSLLLTWLTPRGRGAVAARPPLAFFGWKGELAGEEEGIADMIASIRKRSSAVDEEETGRD